MKHVILIISILFSAAIGLAQDLTVASAVKVQAVETKDLAKVAEWEPVKKGLVTFDDKTKMVTMTTNKTKPDKSWRLVHDGKSVIDRFECSGATESIYAVFVAKTEEEILTEIKKLGLADKSDAPVDKPVKTEPAKLEMAK